MYKIILFSLFTILSASAYAQKESFKPVYVTKAGAIHGYDPVAYFTEGKPVPGKSDITLDYEDATWHFANTANRDSFQLHPEKFAPAYGGFCAYGWSRGYPAKTDPAAWSIVDQKLYLNYDAGVKADWEKKRAEYIKKADANWEKAKQQ
jgi:YHS domain-containing protein